MWRVPDVPGDGHKLGLESQQWAYIPAQASCPSGFFDWLTAGLIYKLSPFWQPWKPEVFQVKQDEKENQANERQGIMCSV